MPMAKYGAADRNPAFSNSKPSVSTSNDIRIRYLNDEFNSDRNRQLGRRSITIFTFQKCWQLCEQRIEAPILCEM